MNILDLPTELLVRICSNLDPPNLLPCQLTTRILHNIIKNSVVIQYQCALNATGAEDNPNCSLSLSERLAMLKRSREAWKSLEPNFAHTISVAHDPSGIYDLTGGVYLLGGSARRVLHYVQLPNEEDEKSVWSAINVDRRVIDMGLAVYEHDLMAVVTTSPSGTNPETHQISLVLLKFSTGETHPLAREPTIAVTVARFDRPAVGIEIVGENLVLILAYYNNPFKPDDRVFVYEWKTGRLKMTLVASYHTYSGLVFLTESVVLFPNTQHGTLEIWEIPSSPNTLAPAQPRSVLCLPQLVRGQMISGISCRGEPNPMGGNRSTRPFHSSANDAIVIFNLRVQPQVNDHHHLAMFQFGHMFTILIHRSALLDLFLSGPSFRPWSLWGPNVSRWFPADVLPTRWITTTCGQRRVTISEDAPNSPSQFYVFDFNPHSVRVAQREGVMERMTDEVRRLVCTSSTMVDPAFGFAEDVSSCLPYVVTESREQYGFDGVLLDEERVIGISTDELDRIRAVEVLHFG